MNWVEFSDEPVIEFAQRGDAPIEYVSATVPVRGEGLSEVWWRGRQWAVTSYGIEALDGCYSFEWNRMMERLDIHGWAEHMSKKNWVDIDDFITAWLVGVALHSRHGERLRRSISKSMVKIHD